jgi:TRAP transporter 4TM/12TM fusion protein
MSQVVVRYLRNASILLLFIYQVLILVYQFQGALESYYFHLGMVLIVGALVVLSSSLSSDQGTRRVFIAMVLTVVLVGSAVSASYLYLNVSEIELRQPFLEQADLYAGIVIVLCVLVLTYMVWGAILAGVIAFAGFYFFFGDLFPGNFRYNPPETEIIVSYLAGMGGARGVLWGIPLSANTLFLIIAFGGLLKGTRILELFNEFGRLLLNVSRGGICYSAILASSLIGMVTGQAVANVALSGSVTIPAMTHQGISKERAGAIEVVASLGSQLIPPIMGLGGFLMAVNLGIPYADVAAAAIVPAFLFVTVLFIAGYFIASVTPSLKVQRHTVDRRLILWLLPSFLISFLTLLTMLYMRYSPGYSALWAIGLLLGLAWLRPAAYRPSLKELWDGLEYGVTAAVNLGLILAGIGIVVQVLVTTGAGFDLGRTIMLVAGDQIWIALILGMLIAALVGLGLPTPAAYALIAIIMIPSLIDLGIDPIVAHFFGFYFAIFSAVTPPVAVGVMAATRISGGSFYRTVGEAVRMSVVAILLPYAFVAFPSLLAFPAIGIEGAVVSVALIVTALFWGATVYGVLGRRLARGERAFLLIVPALCIAMLATGSVVVALTVIIIGFVFGAWNLSVLRRHREPAASLSDD